MYSLYVDNGGSDLSRSLLVAKLFKYFGDNLVALSHPGIAIILAFRNGAAKALRIIPDEDDDNIDIAVAKLKRKIYQEVNYISIDKNSCKARLDYKNTSELVSNTAKSAVQSVAKIKPHSTGYAHRNIISSVLKIHPTQLQISLAVLLQDSKELVKAINDL